MLLGPTTDQKFLLRFSEKCAIVRLSSDVAQRLWNRKWHINGNGSHVMPVSLTSFYGTSPTNQRTESWWSQFRKNRSTWWINYFKDLCERNIFNPDNELESECLWLCLSDVIQKDLDYVKEQWNTHRIRDSKHETIPGIPDELYYFPACPWRFVNQRQKLLACEIKAPVYRSYQMGEFTQR